MDEDIKNEVDVDVLRAEVMRLREGIRRHRDSTGHDLCWYVPELWDLLPEKSTPRPQVPPREEFLRCCAAYRDTLELEEDADERTLTRISYLFSSMACSPELSMRFTDAVQAHSPINVITHLKIELMGWVEDHGGPITADALKHVGRALTQCDQPRRRTGHMLLGVLKNYEK